MKPGQVNETHVISEVANWRFPFKEAVHMGDGVYFTGHRRGAEIGKQADTQCAFNEPIQHDSPKVYDGVG